ncbi:hypothetical protein SDC9_156843 [bioreactor metagenome]|uniref:Uncharacterized protein n=1 Tax=bioreactor metagenome TaxID=1076179 RepID=A0A645F7Q1_9ZZZZ
MVIDIWPLPQHEHGHVHGWVTKDIVIAARVKRRCGTVKTGNRIDTGMSR